MGYQPKEDEDQITQLVSMTKSEIVWPWAGYRDHTDQTSWDSIFAKNGILEFETSVATVILEQLHSPRRPSLRENHFAGWALDSGGRVKTGLQECVLLSKELLGEGEDAWGFQPLNVMLIGRDEDGVCYRKGIGMVRDKDWMKFLPEREKVRLS